MSLKSRINRIERGFIGNPDEVNFLVIANTGMKLPSPGQLWNCPHKECYADKNGYHVDCLKNCEHKCRMPDTNGHFKNCTVAVIRLPCKGEGWKT